MLEKSHRFGRERNLEFESAMNELRRGLIGAVICLGAIVSYSQNDSRIHEGSQVKAAVSSLDLKRRPTVNITRRDLVSLSGVLIGTGEDELSVSFKIGKGLHEVNIRYEDVLEIAGSGIRLSFVPDPEASVQGSWTDVKGIAIYRPIGVVLSNGKEMSGYFGGADDKMLTLIGASAAARLGIPSEIVVRVFGVTDGKNGVKEYTRRGMKAGGVPAPEALVLMPITTGVGAMIGLSKQKKRRVILVFAR